MKTRHRTRRDFVKLSDPAFIQAGPADLERVLAFIKAYYEFDGILFKASEIKRGLEALLGNFSLGKVWLIRSNQKDVGYAILTFGYDLEFGGRQATVTELYITVHYRRLGLAALRRPCRDASLHARTSAELPPPSRLQSTPQSWRSPDTSPDPSPSSHTRSESPHGPLALASKS